MPTGMFDNRAVGDFLQRLFAAPGRTNDFRKLERKLFLVATNLDTGASVTFGGPDNDDVPISLAIEASSALPGLFPPVMIRRRALCRRRAQQDAARLRCPRRRRRPAALRESARSVQCEPGGAGRPAHRGETERRRAADRSVADLPRDHPFANEGRHGEISPPVPARRRDPVRAGPRGCRHVLRQHLQLLASADGSARRRTTRRARTSSRAPKS